MYENKIIIKAVIKIQRWYKFIYMKYNEKFGKHGCIKITDSEDWTIKGHKQMLDINDLFKNAELTKDKLKFIQHKDICWKDMDNPEKRKYKPNTQKINKKYINCNTSYPGILVETSLNPKNRKYRMIDGTHRMAKMYFEDKELYSKGSMFYVIDQDTFFKYLKPYVRYADLYSYSQEQQKEIINKYLNKEDIRRLERIYPNYRWLCI